MFVQCKEYANLLYQLGTIYGLIQQISNIGDVFDTGGQDYCSVLEDKKDDFLDGGSGSGPSGSAERSATQYG